MKNFFNNMKKHGILVLNILIIIGSTYFICKSEKFQEKISPNKYWDAKVKALQSELKKDYVKIKFLQLDLERENALFPYQTEMARIQAQEMGEDFNEVYKEMQIDHAKKLNDIKLEIAKLVKEEEEVKINLQAANNQIRNYK